MHVFTAAEMSQIGMLIKHNGAAFDSVEILWTFNENKAVCNGDFVKMFANNSVGSDEDVEKLRIELDQSLRSLELMNKSNRKEQQRLQQEMQVSFYFKKKNLLTYVIRLLTQHIKKKKGSN